MAPSIFLPGHFALCQAFRSISSAASLSALCVVAAIMPRALAQEPAGKNYLLQYKLKAGEEIVSDVEHIAETRTKMSGTEETSSSRTNSRKVWRVTEVNENGDMTFEYQIVQVNLSQSVGDNQALTYDSSKDKDIPDIFKPVAETIGRTLATVTINPRGQVVNRDKDLKTPQLGMGELTVPLPENPIAVGDNWAVPREIRVKLESGAYKKIKVRELYTLEKVTTGVATIRLVTQALTPVNDPSVESQLIQQMSQGELRFDIDNGRLLTKRLDWQEEVVGFRGPETSLRYDGKFTEKLMPSNSRTASGEPSKKR